MRPGAVTFDFGQTLTELDCDLLSRRLAERGILAEASALQAAVPGAWRSYDRACATSEHPWHLFMHTLLRNAGVSGELEPLVDWLYSEQPKLNLWRKPIPGMIELVERVAATGTKVAVISNSEGKLARLAEELGWQEAFEVIADSGLLGSAKPGAEIFEWTGARLGVSPKDFVHIGDSWVADVQGIRNLGGRAIWFGGASIAPEPPEGAHAEASIALCRSAAEVRAALRTFGVPL